MNTKVKVYRNLHKHCYSILTYKTGIGWRLWKHTNDIWLIDVKFIVSQAGRERVRRENKKNVHAFIVGYISNISQNIEMSRISYNPYEMDCFEQDTGRAWEPIYDATCVHLTQKGAYANAS